MLHKSLPVTGGSAHRLRLKSQVAQATLTVESWPVVRVRQATCPRKKNDRGIEAVGRMRKTTSVAPQKANATMTGSNRHRQSLLSGAINVRVACRISAPRWRVKVTG